MSKITEQMLATAMGATRLEMLVSDVVGAAAGEHAEEVLKTQERAKKEADEEGGTKNDAQRRAEERRVRSRAAD